MHLLGLLNFTAFVSTAGYGAVFILCLLQSCCVPTSSELTMGFAGVLAAEGKLSLAGVIAVGVLGEVVGAYIAWVVGRYAGRGVVDRFGRYLLLTHHDLDRAEDWYDRHQRFGVFGSRLLPVIRNFVALPAGIAEVPLVRFGALTAAGSLLWDGAWAGIGYGVGGDWHAIASAFGDVGYVLAVVAVAVIAYAAYHRYHSYKSAQEGTPGPRGPRHAAARPVVAARDRHAATGSVRWLAGSSGRPPARGDLPDSTLRAVEPPAGEPPGGEPAGGEPPGGERPGGGLRAGGPRISDPDDALQWVGSSSGRPAARPAARARRSEFPGSPIAAWEAAVRRGSPESPGRPRPQRQPQAQRQPRDAAAAEGQLPLVGRLFPAPVAAKVPEVIFVFWVVKVLTTAGGEATSDYLRIYGNLKGGAVEVGLFVLGLLLQFGTRRYRAFAYWFLAFAVAIFGTGVSDFLHLDVHIPYAGTTLLWAVVLAAVFFLWQHSEGTLSIHSITTQRREAYYWATVFATFALGTALGDFTASSLQLGYLASGILFAVVIFLPALAWSKFGLNGVAAFWMSYVVTRPLGASFADYLSKPHSLSGIDFGDGPTALVFAAAVVVLVAYLAVVRPDIQRPVRPTDRRAPPLERRLVSSTRPRLVGVPGPDRQGRQERPGDEPEADAHT